MTAFTGKGATLSYYDTTLATWVQVTDVVSISGPTTNRETVDTTTLDSDGGFRQFIPSLIDSGDMSLNVHFQQDTYQFFLTEIESTTLRSWIIVMNDDLSTSLSFSGFVTDLPVDIPLDDVVSADVTIKISGRVTMSSIDVIESVETLADINKANGTQLADVGLPSTVEVTFTDGHTDDVAVVWNNGSPTFDGDTADTYTFTGTLQPGTGIYNPSALTATVDVVIAS